MNTYTTENILNTFKKQGKGERAMGDEPAKPTDSSGGTSQEDDDGEKLDNMALRQRAVVRPSLHPLIFTRHIFLRLCQIFDTNLQKSLRNYEVYNTFGSRIYLVSVGEMEATGLIGIGKAYTTDKYEGTIWNHLGYPVLRFEGDNGRCGHGAGISVSFPDDFVLGRVAQENNTCFLQYSILDNAQGPTTALLRVRGPRRECGCCGGLSVVDDLALYTDKNKFIGRITQRWAELGENYIPEDENSFNSFGLTFPIEMSPNLKAVVLSFLILLDLQFCPSTKGWREIRSNRGHICLIIFMLSLILAVTLFLAFYLVTQSSYMLL